MDGASLLRSYVHRVHLTPPSVGDLPRPHETESQLSPERGQALGASTGSGALTCCSLFGMKSCSVSPLVTLTLGGISRGPNL